jgi:hypothetical protein
LLADFPDQAVKVCGPVGSVHDCAIFKDNFLEVYPSMDVGKRLEAGRILAVYPGAESEEEVLGRQHQILRWSRR